MALNDLNAPRQIFWFEDVLGVKHYGEKQGIQLSDGHVVAIAAVHSNKPLGGGNHMRRHPYSQMA